MPASSAPRILTDGPWGLGLLRPQALFGLDLPPLVHGVLLSLAVNIACYIGCSLSRAADVDRAGAGRSVRALDLGADPGADGAELPAAARLGHGRGTDRDRRALSRRGAHPRIVRELRRLAPHQPRSAGRGRLPAAAIRRISAGLGDRRGVVAAGAVAAVAQAHGLDQGRAETARRRQCGDPLQPRDSADRARSRAPGHRGVRQGPQSGLLEPAVRRDLRSAARPHPRRHRARRDLALHRPARRRRRRRFRRGSSPSASPNTPPRSSRSSNASPSAGW